MTKQQGSQEDVNSMTLTPDEDTNDIGDIGKALNPQA
jgi:hypothetical protein